MSLEDRFDIQPPIHVGQVATAYPAVQKGLDRKVLLKVIHPQWTGDSELVERFSREGKAMARIDHPNVVQVYECGEEDGVPYLALEWVEGGTLSDRMAEGPLPPQEVRQIAAEILAGLGAVHAQGLIHRDLKPDNILVGGDGRICLADFSLVGFTRLKGLTGHQSIVGSPAYLAPELTRGEQATRLSDLYGSGVILLEALTGSNPFAADDPLVSLDLVRQVNPPRLSGHQRIDPGLARLVDGLLERNPDRRPPSAEAALELLTGEAAKPPPSPRRSDAVRWAAVIVAAAVALTLLLTSGGVVRQESYRPARIDIPVGPLPSMTVKIPEGIGTPDSEQKHTTATLPSVQPIKIQESAPYIKNLVRGQVTIIARPWAAVEIDGRGVGVTPLGTVELAAGRHKVVFRHDKFPPVRRVIEVAAGCEDTLAVDLREGAAQAQVAAVPWGYLWVDGDSIGLLPRPEPLWLTPGEHSLEVTHPELGRWAGKMAFRAGARIILRVDMTSGTMVAVEE